MVHRDVATLREECVGDATEMGPCLSIVTRASVAAMHELGTNQAGGIADYGA